MNAPELVGYLASALVVASLAMRSVVKRRLLSLAGAILFATYGLLTAAWPVVIAAVALGVHDVWRLRREMSPQPAMAAVPLEPDSPFLHDFLGAHAVEIQHSQPDFHPSASDRFVRLLTREGLPAGVIIGEPAGNELVVRLDYVTPAYRDSQIARWMFGPGRRIFTDAGFTRLVTTASTAQHRNYLDLVGFRPEGSLHVLDLTR